MSMQVHHLQVVSIAAELLANPLLWVGWPWQGQEHQSGLTAVTASAGQGWWQPQIPCWEPDLGPISSSFPALMQPHADPSKRTNISLSSEGFLKAPPLQDTVHALLVWLHYYWKVGQGWALDLNVNPFIQMIWFGTVLNWLRLYD